MSSVVIAGDVSGTITLDAPAIAGTTTLTLPTTSGTVLTRNSSAPANSLVVDASGNVGIGTTTMTGRFNSIPKSGYDAAGTSWAQAALSASGTYGGGLSIIDGSAGYVLNVQDSGGTFVIRQGTVGSIPSERMRIDTSGNLLVGDTAQVGAGQICSTFNQAAKYGLALKNSSATATGVFAGFYNSGGTLQGYINQTNSTTVAYITSSDYRLKENIAPMTGALNTVAQLKPCTYTWKENGSAGQGFIAHELAKICPDAVSGEKDAVETYKDQEGNEQTRIKPQGVDTSFLVATLTAAIQELKAELDAVKTELATIKQGAA